MVVNYPAPGNWSEFEDLCKELFEAEFSMSDVHRYGRAGQRQNGIDILGFAEARKSLVGIQCKQKQVWPVSKLNIKEDIIDEIEAACLYPSALAHYFIATTANRDIKYNNALVQYLSGKSLPFKVELFCWEDINIMLNRHSSVAIRYYPSTQSLDDLPLSQQLGISPGNSVFYVYSGTVFGRPNLLLRSAEGRTTFFAQEERLFFDVNADFNHMMDPNSQKNIGHLYLDLAHPINLFHTFTGKNSLNVSVSIHLSERTCEVRYVCEDYAYAGFSRTSYSGVYYFKGEQAYTDTNMSLYHEKNEILKKLFNALKNIHGRIIKQDGLIK